MIKHPAANRRQHQSCTSEKVEPQRICAPAEYHDCRIDEKKNHYAGGVSNWMPPSDQGSDNSSHKAGYDCYQSAHNLNT